MHLISFAQKFTVSNLNIETKNKGKEDLVICQEGRSEKWVLKFSNPVGSEGIHLQSSFFKVNETLFLFLQIYEHARGGSIHYYLNAVSYEGIALWQKDINSIYFDSIIYEDENFCWVLNTWPPDRTAIPGKMYLGSDLVRIDLSTGSESRRIKLCADLAHVKSKAVIDSVVDRFKIYPFRLSLTEDDRDVLIKVDNISFENGDPFQEQTIPVTSIL